MSLINLELVPIRSCQVFFLIIILDGSTREVMFSLLFVSFVCFLAELHKDSLVDFPES